MEKTQNLLIAYDYYCPSIQSKLHSRVCSICKQYIPTATRLRNHYKVHQQRYALNSVDYKFHKEEELIDEPDPIDNNNQRHLYQINPLQNGVFLFSDMTEWLKSDFEDDPVIPGKVKSTASMANAMIRREKQLQEAAAAAMGVSSITEIGPPPLATTTSVANIESVVTISVDNALTSTNEIIPLDEIKIENDNVVDAMEHLVVNDNRRDSTDTQTDNLLNQYDDLSDLIDQI